MLWNLTFTYLLFSIPYVNSSNMIIAIGPYIYNINLSNGNILAKYFYLPYCGSYSCLPLCTNVINNKILLGTSGALIAIKNGAFEVLSNQPTFVCEDVIVHNIIYHDAFNAKMVAIIERGDTSQTLDNCICLGFARNVMTLMCKGDNFLMLGKRRVKVDAPAVLSKPSGDLIAALTANGQLYIINTTSMKVIDKEKLDVMRVSPSIPWPWRGGFLIPTPHTLYYWKGGELYYYRVRGILLGVFANDNVVILAKLLQDKLVIVALSSEELRFQEVGGGSIV